MKHILFSLGLIFPILVFAVNENRADSARHYIPTSDLYFTEQGIFLKSTDSTLSLGSISFDYAANSFFITEESLARSSGLVKCGYCGRRTYDPETGECYNSECPYYKYFRAH